MKQISSKVTTQFTMEVNFREFWEGLAELQSSIKRDFIPTSLLGKNIEALKQFFEDKEGISMSEAKSEFENPMSNVRTLVIEYLVGKLGNGIKITFYGYHNKITNCIVIVVEIDGNHSDVTLEKAQ